MTPVDGTVIQSRWTRGVGRHYTDEIGSILAAVRYYGQGVCASSSSFPRRTIAGGI
jgi:hypothetical protein